MPVYEVTGASGLTLELEGDAPPSESELDSIFAQAQGQQKQPDTEESRLASFVQGRQAPETFRQPEDFNFRSAIEGGPRAQLPESLDLSPITEGFGDIARNVGRVAFMPLLPQTSDAGQAKATLTQMRLAQAMEPTQDEGPVDTASPIATGIVKGLDNLLVQGLLTPVGVATLGMGTLPRLAQRGISLAFATDMIRHAPSIASEIEAEMSKPTEERNQERLAQLFTEYGGTAAFSTMAAKHGLSPNPKGVLNARQITSPEGLPQSEIRSRLGQEAPLRQRGETPGAEVAQAPQEAGQSVRLTPEEWGRDVAPVLEDSTVGVKLAPLPQRAIESIDRATGEVLLSESEFGPWLRDIEPSRRQQAVRSIVSEGEIHLAVPDEAAIAYLKTLSAPEVAIGTRIYTGKWKRPAEISETMLGHDLLRFRMQQLARMTPREIAEAATLDRWGLQGLDAVGRAIQKTREKLGTKASKEGLAILGEMEKNLGIARAAVIGQAQSAEAEQPFAFNKDEVEKGKFMPVLVTESGKLYPGHSHADAQMRAIKSLRAGEITPEEFSDITLAMMNDEQHKFVNDAGEVITREQAGEQSKLGGAVQSEDLAKAGLLSAIREPVEAPLAYKKRKETSEQGMFFLPPAPKGIERPGAVESGAEVVTPAKISQAAAEHLSTEQPSFKRFAEESSRRFGGVKPAQLRDAWEDAVWKSTMEASGEKLSELRRTLKLERDIGTKQVADALAPEQAANPVAVREARAVQNYRKTVQSSVARKLIEQSYAGESLKKALGRQTLDVDDLAHSKPGFFREISAEEAANPTVLSRLLTEDFRGMQAGTTLPESNTRRVVALVDKTSGEVRLVSVYEHPRTGTMVVDPRSPSKARPNVMLGSLLKQYRPIATALLDEPIRNFHQKFGSVREFNEKFANDARAALEAQAAYEARLEPRVGVLEPTEEIPSVLEPGQKMTAAQAGSMLDVIQDTVGKLESPQDVADTIAELGTKFESKKLIKWDAIAGFRKAYDALRRVNPDATLNDLYEDVFRKANEAQSREAFQRRALQSYGGEDFEALRGIPETGAEGPSPTSRELRALDRPPIPGRAVHEPGDPSRFPFERGPGPEWLARGRGIVGQRITPEPVPIPRRQLLAGGKGVLTSRAVPPLPQAGPLVKRAVVPPASEGTTRPLAFNKRTKERAFWAARGLTDPIGAFNRWYGQWLSEAVRSNGGERANEAATISDAIVDRAKKLYGEETDLVNPAKELAGGSARLPVIGEVPNPAAIKRNVWLQKLAHPVSRNTGIANVQEAVEGRLTAPPALQPTINAIGLANLQAGRLVQRVTPGFVPSNKWQRNMTPFGYDMLAEGSSHPNWKSFTRDTALDPVNQVALRAANPAIRTRGDAIRFTRQFFREWGEALKDPTTDVNRIEKVNQDFKRFFPRAVTHVRTPIGYQEVIHANPVNYLEFVAQRAAFTRAFREQFPPTTAGRRAFAQLDAGVRGELPPNIVPYWDALVRTMQSRPADSYTSLGPMRPGAPLGEFIKGFNSTALATLKRLALSAQAVMGAPETLGTGVAELGMRNKLAGAAKLKQLWHEFEKRGQVNAMIYDWSFDPSSPIRSLFRQSNNILAKGFAENLHNELQGRWNAATATAAADRIRHQQAEPLSAWEKRQYPETFRKMQFTKDQVDAMMQGDEPLLQAFERRFPSWMSGENAPMAERSMGAQKRWFNSVFAFQPYPMTIANQFTRNASRLGEAFREGTRAEKIAAIEGMARFMFAKGAMGLGYLTLGALISGGLPGVRVKSEEAKDEPMQFMVEALLSSLSGPYYLVWQAMRRGGGLAGAGETVTRTAFPFSQFLDVQDMVQGNGQYRDQDLQARVGRYFLQKVPAARAIRQGLAAAGLADANPQLEAAMAGAARWKRDELGWDQRQSFREEDTRKQFRTKMRAAVTALQKNDLDTYLERLAEAVNEATELGGKTKPTARVASSLRGRRILRTPDGADLTPEQLDALSKRIGEGAVERLRYYDATLEGMAKSLE